MVAIMSLNMSLYHNRALVCLLLSSVSRLSLRGTLSRQFALLPVDAAAMPAASAPALRVPAASRLMPAPLVNVTLRYVATPRARLPPATATYRSFRLLL